MRAMVALAVLGATVLAACGEGDGGDPSPSPASSPPAGPVTAPASSPAPAATYAPGTTTNQSSVDDLVDAAANGDVAALLDRTMFSHYTCGLPLQTSHPPCSADEKLELFRFSAVEDQFRDRAGMQELYDGIVGGGAGLLAVYGGDGASSSLPASTFVIWLAPSDPNRLATALYLDEDGAIVFLTQSLGGIDEGLMVGREVILPPR